ncbi:MAG: FAD-binding oxidoreductase [Sandaracinaceae bacterium]
MRHDRTRIRWNGWGWRDHTFDLRGRGDALWAYLAEALDVGSLPDTPAAALADVRLPEPALDHDTLARLAALTHASRVRTDRRERAFHALGRSYVDLLRLRRGAPPDAPDAVVYPADAAEVRAVLRLAAERDVAVVPYGGGSSVVGGVEARRGAHAGLLTLDTTRMSGLLGLDARSRTATFAAGIHGPDLEAALRPHGLTLGHFPQSFEFSTLGGWLAARGAGQASNRYGTAADLLVCANVATPGGELATRPVPASAAGPDPDAWIAGSEGTLGVITEATVRVRPLPARRTFAAYAFRRFEAGIEAVRTLVQGGADIATLRLSDPDETFFFGALRRVLSGGGGPSGWVRDALRSVGYGRPSVLLAAMEGTWAEVRGAGLRLASACVARGGVALGARPGRRWYASRFETPYLRDPMLDRGLGVETLETAASWTRLPELHAAVREALTGALEARGRRGLVLGHVSHAYPDGASLYYTVVFPREPEDEVGQWRALKAAATDAILDHGGTVSHHHGVGLEHRPWLRAERGEAAVAMLRAAKAAIDPTGILNPDKLLPDPAG